MVKLRPSSPAPSGQWKSDPSQEFIQSLDRYLANFDLMLSSWKSRDIYDVVSEDFTTLMQLQKASFPEASVVMIDLVIAHNDAAVVLLDLHKSCTLKGPARFTEKDLSKRQETHGLAGLAVRNFVLRKTH